MERNCYQAFNQDDVPTLSFAQVGHHFDEGISVAEDLIWLAEVLGASLTTWENAGTPERDTVWDFMHTVESKINIVTGEINNNFNTWKLSREMEDNKVL